MWYMQKYTIIAIIGLLVLGGFGLIYFKAEAPGDSKPQTMEENVSPAPEDSAPEGGAAPVPASPSSGTVKKPSTVSTQNQGRVVFSVTDDAVNLETLQSLTLTIGEVSVFHPTKGWITVLNSPKHFDLVRLYRNPVREVLADLTLEAADYSQVRLIVNRLALMDKSGNLSEVKLPSKEIKIQSRLLVTKGGNSGVVLDFLADKSLFLTGSGKYIFLPVFKVETRSSIETIQIFSGKADFIGGKTDFDVIFGMDEKGNLKKDFKFDGAAKFEIEGDSIKLLPR